MDNMSNKNDMKRLIEIVADMLDEQRLTRKDINGLKLEMTSVKEEIVGLRHDQSETNKRLNKNTLAVSELRLSVMKLGDKLEDLIAFDKRIKALEKAVFK
jgi:hypothetical protein